MGKKLIPWLFVYVCCMVFSCKKKTTEEPQPQPKPEPARPVLEVKYAHRIGTDTFLLNKDYINSSAETFRINTLEYILSNFKLKKKDGTELALPNTYFLVDPKKSSVALYNIPEGTYTGISYLVGVDSLTSAGGAKTGALDPVNGLYWPWMGYIHFKMIGTSPSSIYSTKVFTYEVGGFIAPNQTLQMVSHTFGQDSLVIKKDISQLINVSVDILEFFKNPVDISIASVSSIMDPGKDAVTAASNYKDMFTFQNIRH